MINWVFIVCFAFLSTETGGDIAVLSAREHPWGNFAPKSWQIVQTVTVSNIDNRLVQSTQTTRTELVSIDNEGITLQETGTQSVGGINVEKQPKRIKYDFFQETIKPDVRIRQGTPVKLMISRRVIPCSVRIYEQQTPTGHLTTTIWYTSHVYPYVLRTERILRSIPDAENAGGQIIRQSVTLVQETTALRTFRSNRRNKSYKLQTVEKMGGITKITDSQCSWDVPGGLLESTTKEFDAQNRETQRSVSKMTNFWSPGFLAPQTNPSLAVPLPSR